MKATYRHKVTDKTATVPRATALSFTLFLEATDTIKADPAPPPTAEDGVLQRRRRGQDTLAAEGRPRCRMDDMRSDTHRIVESFNIVLQKRLGEVPAKYRVAFADF